MLNTYLLSCDCISFPEPDIFPYVNKMNNMTIVKFSTCV